MLIVVKMHHSRISLEMANFYRYSHTAMEGMYLNECVPTAATLKRLSCIAQEL